MISAITKMSASLNGATGTADILMATNIEMHVVSSTVNACGARLQANTYHAGGVLALSLCIVAVHFSLELVNSVGKGVCWFIALA